MEMTIDQALLKAVGLHKNGKFDEAEDIYRAIIHAQPHHPDANHNLGILLSNLGKIEIALPLLKIAYETNPTFYQFWISYLSALIKAENINKAREIFSQRKIYSLSTEDLKKIKNSIELASLTINIRNKPSKNKSQISRSKKIVKTKISKNARQIVINLEHNQHKFSPSNIEINKLLSWYKASDFINAEEQAILLAQKFPNHPIGWKTLGIILSQAGRQNDALSFMRKAIELDPTDAETHNNLSIILYNLKLLIEAEEICKKAIILNPNFANAHNNLGNILKNLGRLHEAETSYRQAIKIQSDFADAYNNLGDIYYNSKRFSEAKTCFLHAVNFRPNFAEAHSNLGLALMQFNLLSEAEKAFREAIKLKSDFPDALNNLGNLLTASNRHLEAIEIYKKVIKINPNLSNAFSNLGNCLFELGSLEEAEASCRESIRLNAENNAAYNNLGNVLKELGNIDEAQACYEKSLILNPDSAQTYNNIATIYAKKGNLNKAENYYLKALEIDLNLTDAIFNLADLWTFTGRVPEALDLYKKLVGYIANLNGLKAAVRLAIHSFLSKNISNFYFYVKLAEPIFDQKNKFLENDKIYLSYLKSLIAKYNYTKEFNKEEFINNKLYIIGDSHVLALVDKIVSVDNNFYQCEPLWIMGIKQWHCASNKINMYSHKFDLHVSSLKDNDCALFVVGEIDCRLDEGILKFSKSSPKHKLSDIIDVTVNGYLSRIKKLTDNKSLDIIISSIPAPNESYYRDQITSNEFNNYKTFIQLFNRILEKHVKAMNYGYLDLYALTKQDSQLIDNKSWHIDSVHLLPEAYSEAFVNYFHRKITV